MNSSDQLANPGDDHDESTVAVNKMRKKMKLLPHKIQLTRNWLDLPPDVWFIIFDKLGPFDIVYRAQSVCSVWRNLSKQPPLFRFINLWTAPWQFVGKGVTLTEIEKQVIDRSCGHLVGLSMVIYEPEMDGSEEVLHYALDNPNSLKFLDIEGVSADGLMIAITKVPFLEKLELSLSSSYFDCPGPQQVITEIGKSCLQLKYFSWSSKDTSYYYVADDEEYEDEEILAIAEYMPQLRELHLKGNMVTNKGMQAILRGCPYLEYLNLEKCFSDIDPNEEPFKECWERIKTLKLPTHRLCYGSPWSIPTVVPCNLRLPYADDDGDYGFDGEGDYGFDGEGDYDFDDESGDDFSQGSGKSDVPCDLPYADDEGDYDFDDESDPDFNQGNGKSDGGSDL